MKYYFTTQKIMRLISASFALLLLIMLPEVSTIDTVSQRIAWPAIVLVFAFMFYRIGKESKEDKTLKDMHEASQRFNANFNQILDDLKEQIESHSIESSKISPVERCQNCKFDWTEFHKDLDMAAAHLIEEHGRLLSETSVMSFIEYSNAKKQLQENGATENNAKKKQVEEKEVSNDEN